MGRRVGIDLGTTNSLIAFTDRETLQCVKLEGESFPMAVFASCVGVGSDGTLVYGAEARRAPERVSAFKRHIGTDVEWTLGGRTYNAVQLSALLLAEMQARFEERYGPIESAVITVPANFTDRQRHETHEAGRLAGLNVSRVINEPSAAAIAYSLSDLPPGENAVVIDWGGGTLDVSVLDCLENVLDIRANDGDPTCGGNDVDAVILGLLEERIAPGQRMLLRDPAVRRELALCCEEVKIHLSDHTEWSEPIRLASRGLVLDFRLRRSELEARITPLVDRVLAAARRCLEKAPEGAIDPRSVTDVILVGGSCRIPLLQQRVHEYFGQPGRMDLNHLEVVALGAAYQAEHATEAGDLVTLHSLATSLGVECTGKDRQGVVRRDLFQVILPSSTKLPAKASRTFYTVEDDQAEIRIAIYETESETVRGLVPWDVRTLSGLPPARAGECPIVVTFEYGLEQLLRVTVEIEEMGVREEWVAQFRQDLALRRPASEEKVSEARRRRGIDPIHARS